MRRADEFHTFFDVRIEDALSKAGGDLTGSLRRLPASSLSNDNEDELAARLAERFALEVPHLDFDSVKVEQSTTMVPAEHFPITFSADPGKSYEKKTAIFRIPYRGDPAFLRCYHSTRSMNPARVFLDGSEVCFEVLSLRFDMDEIERDRDAVLAHLQRFLPPVASAVQAFNEGLHARAVGLIRDRKKEIEADSDVLAGLGTPVASPSAPPATLAVSPPVKRRVIRVARTDAVPGRTPDPTLDQQTYEDILTALSDYGKQMERTAATYAGMGEEDIRNHIIGNLQAGFPSGSATGESFNRSGKTDILLRHENDNLFVAECKVWSGPKAYLAAISQLLGYLTWRDSKTALLLFVRNKDMSNVLTSIETKAPTHAEFVSADDSGTGVFRFRFNLPGDPGSEVCVAVLAFHLP